MRDSHGAYFIEINDPPRKQAPKQFFSHPQYIRPHHTYFLISF